MTLLNISIVLASIFVIIHAQDRNVQGLRNAVLSYTTQDCSGRPRYHDVTSLEGTTVDLPDDSASFTLNTIAPQSITYWGSPEHCGEDLWIEMGKLPYEKQEIEVYASQFYWSLKEPPKGLEMRIIDEEGFSSATCFTRQNAKWGRLVQCIKVHRGEEMLPKWDADLRKLL